MPLPPFPVPSASTSAPLPASAPMAALLSSRPSPGPSPIHRPLCRFLPPHSSAAATGFYRFPFIFGRCPLVDSASHEACPATFLSRDEARRHICSHHQSRRHLVPDGVPVDLRTLGLRVLVLLHTDPRASHSWPPPLERAD